MFRSIVTVLAFTVLIGCKNENGKNVPDNAIDPGIVNNPITASADSAALSSKDGFPVLKFEKDVHDFGVIMQGEKISYAYKFTNTGNAPLIIRSAQGSCGCTVPDYPKEAIEPGQSGVVNVTFDSEGKTGHQDKTVTIISNTSPNTYTLHIVGDIKTTETN